MSHADEGTLHAYLDGELSPVERARIETHCAECPSCRDRLAEERSLIERADRVLKLAAPPAGHVNRLVPLPRRPRLVVPGVWAASIAAAFLAGWMLRPRDNAKVAQLAASPTPSAPAPISPSAGTPRPMARAAAAPSATNDRLERAQDSLAVQSEPGPILTPGVVGNAAAPTLRGTPPTPIPAAKVTITPPPALPRASVASRPAIGTTWTAIAPEPAREVLGADVVRIPGLPIRDILQNPMVPGAVMVEQEVAAGTVIQLLQSRTDTSFGRTVGGVHVRISGPLSIDSLLKLLQLAR